MISRILQQNVDFITKEVGNKSPIVVKNFYIGKSSSFLNCAIIYKNALIDKNILDRDVLNPLMLHVDIDLTTDENTPDFICKKYIPMCSTSVEKDINKAIEGIKSGKTVILIDQIQNFIIVDTAGGEYRSIADSINETAVRGPREAFVEKLETNISILRRNIKDKNLVVESFVVGRRSQTSLSVVYIEDIADKDIVNEIIRRINLIDVDYVTDTGMIGQYIEDSTYSIFPQFFTTERPDITEANLMEGRIAILLNGTPYVITVPALLIEFIQGVEDYYTRPLVASFGRFIRFIAIFIIITVPSLYLSVISYNVELIPTNFINPIVQFRKGIALTPFLEILAMELMVEFLREGGLRLPSKIAQTLSIVGGIIIGNTAVQSKIVSPTTLLVIGVTVIATFLIPNYQMSLAIRLIRFPMLIFANMAGLLGIVAGWYIILVHLYSLKSFGVPYLSFNKNDMEDTFIRYPLYTMKKRPEAIPNDNPKRKGNFIKRMVKKNE